MKIVNGKKFYAADIKAARRIDGNGWDKYNGQNWQWYSLFYNPACGLVILKANNSGNCYGDYTDRYFENPEAFRAWCETVPESMTADTLRKVAAFAAEQAERLT